MVRYRQILQAAVMKRVKEGERKEAEARPHLAVEHALLLQT